jgi:glyoxylase-like metal-dependent hydrolase (beta-lactamase superfamily II)
MHGKTDSLSYPWPIPPEPGHFIEVAPGLLWFRLALPYQLNHVNIYLLEHEGGWAAVDAGLGNDVTRAAWEALLAGRLANQKITRLIITHSHPDHVGLAGWIAERFGCPLIMTRSEYLQAAYNEAPRTGVQITDRIEYYRGHGIPGDTIEALIGRGSNYLTRVTPLPSSFERAADGGTLKIGQRSFEVMTGGGHSIEQMMLLSRSEKLFLSADQVLSKISPNVSVHSLEPDADSLGDYLASLHRLARDLPDDVLVLPGHGVPFYGATARIKQLIDHHADRCNEIAAACAAESLTASQMVPLIFHRPLDAHQSGFATGEVVAHINYMLGEGRLQKVVTTDGVKHFKAA